MNNRRAGRAWAAAAAYAALIFFLSSLPAVTPLPLAEKYHTDWLLHGVEYGVFGALLARAFAFSFNWRTSALFAAVFFTGVLYAASDEWHQAFVPTRDPSRMDLAADALGVTAGFFAWTRRSRFIPERKDGNA